jgi:hypothetical protein
MPVYSVYGKVGPGLRREVAGKTTISQKRDSAVTFTVCKHL